MYNLRLLLLRSLLQARNAGAGPAQRLLVSSYKRRPQLSSLPPDQLEQLKADYFEQRSSLSDEEWRNVRHTLIESYKHINAHNIDAVILGVCSAPEQLPLAKSYLEHLRCQGQAPNAATLGRLLRVYNAASHTRPLSAEEQQEILDISQTLRGAHETLDASSCEHLIHGLVATDAHWQQAESLLEMMKVTSTPTVAAYSALIAKAFSAQRPERDLAWRLLEEMLQSRKLPKCEVYLSYLEKIAKEQSASSFAAQLEQLLQFLGRHEIAISDKVAQQLLTLAEIRPQQQLQVSTTRLDRLGKCANCQQQLQHVAIGESEFEQLRDNFLKKVLIRADVFQKSSPEEVARFKQFIEQTAPYDCVIDGLNVAYSMGAKKPPQQLAKLLAAVVRYFQERRQHVLVLGRKHMKSWSKPAMQYIHNNASVFLTNNLTQDDPFLLYATLRSGQRTDFFSRDLMRSHAFLLGNELKPIFRRWQQEHQYALVTQTQTGQIIVKEPMRYRLGAHKVGVAAEAHWHLPCCETYTPHSSSESFQVPDRWLCLKVSDR